MVNGESHLLFQHPDGSTEARRRPALAKMIFSWPATVPWGTHICQLYDHTADLLETLVPYFKFGLEHGEKCMWLTSGPVESHQAKTSLEMVLPTIGDSCTARQLEIFDGEQWYKQSGRLKPTHQILAAWVEKLDDALRSGFTGLRVTGNTALIENRDWGKFIEYESSINKVIPELRIKALCSYSLKKCRTSELVDALNTHQSAVIKQAGVWMKIGSTAEFVDTAGQRVLHKETPQS